MARGWESKSVESQMDAAEDRRLTTRRNGQREEDLRVERERESIELSKVRVRRDLENAKHPRHREQLMAALAHLDRQLQQLSSFSSVAEP